jgi:hypothetical protein
MSRVDEKVVGNAAGRKLAQAVDHARLHEPGVVGFALDEVPDALELRVRGDLVELPPDVAARQIDPCDNARDERVRVGQVEQPPRLLDAVARLNEDGSDDAALARAA